ncbi:MAG: ribonuclease HII, partial [Arenibacterium sp.]
MTAPDDTLESALRASGYLRIAGVDEVGRGPLAGPVVAAAVILRDTRAISGLNDSKKLSATRRETLCHDIRRCADVAVAKASVVEIDALNILRATPLAMERAVAALVPPPAYLLIDGNMIPPSLTQPGEAGGKGDEGCVSLSAA